MRIDCNIIRDLLPLYAENLVSRESADLVEAHLAGCPACREELKALRPGQPEMEAEIPAARPYAEESVPLKKVKRRLLRNRILIALASAALVITLFFCHVVLASFTMDYGSSTLYSRAEMDRAADVVQLYLGVKIGGCKLLSLEYAGDRVSRQALERVNAYDNPGKPYTDCMVFDSYYRVGAVLKGDLPENRKVPCPWILVRRGRGPWVVAVHGNG